MAWPTPNSNSVTEMRRLSAVTNIRRTSSEGDGISAATKPTLPPPFQKKTKLSSSTQLPRPLRVSFIEGIEKWKDESFN